MKTNRCDSKSSFTVERARRAPQAREIALLRSSSCMQRSIVENAISRRAIARGWGCRKPHAIALRLMGLKAIDVRPLSLPFLRRTVFHGRGAIRGGMAKFAVIVGAALFSVAAFAGIFAWLMTSNGVDPTVQLTAGLRLLKKGKPHEARMLVATLGDKELESPPDQSKQLLILGAAALDQAERLDAPQLIYSHAVEAQDYLSKSQKIGFPRGYEGYGNFLWGKSLYQLFRWEEAREPLELAVAEWPSGRSQALERLVDIELHHVPREQAKLKHHFDQWLNMPGMTPEELNLGQVKRLEAAFADQDWSACRALAEAIPDDSKFAPRAEYWLARVEMEIAKANDRSILQSAAQHLQSVIRNSAGEMATRRRAEYYLGVARHRLGDSQAALSTFNGLRQKFPDSIEGLMAAIEEMQVLAELNNFAEVPTTLQRMKRQLGKLEWYQNSWITYDEMADRLRDIGQRLLEHQAYAETIGYAEHWPPFGKRIDQLRLVSTANRRWAESLRGRSIHRDTLLDIRQVRSIQASKDQINQQQQKLYSAAAREYHDLSNLLLRTPEYFELIWSAIDCSQAAGELAYCNTLILSAMNFEPRDYQPRSLIKMAENHFAMQQVDESLALLQRCISQFPQNALTYQARLNAARILNERDDFKGAADELEQNLYLSNLDPDNIVWRESLFELGRSYYESGEKLYAEAVRLKGELLFEQTAKRLENLEQSHRQFTQSIERYEEWIRRFPNDERRYDTLYSVGQAYQMAAQLPRTLVDEQHLTSEDLKRAKSLEYRKLLDSARQTFKEIRDGINASTEWSSLDPTEQRRIRNSYFAEADLLFQAKDFDQALSSYRNIANRLVNEPESLEALVQAAECLKALGRFEESQGVVTQAKEVLQQIPSQLDSTFLTLTRFNRLEWVKHLDWMSQNKL
jgi:tetratricopeptide (TPR) repeat protein